MKGKTAHKKADRHSPTKGCVVSWEYPEGLAAST